MAQPIFNESESKEKAVQYIAVQIPGKTPLVTIRDLAEMLGCHLRRLQGGQLVMTPQSFTEKQL